VYEINYRVNACLPSAVRGEIATVRQTSRASWWLNRLYRLIVSIRRYSTRTLVVDVHAETDKATVPTPVPYLHPPPEKVFPGGK